MRADRVETPSHMTTPDLVFPEDLQPLSTSNPNVDHAYKQRRSGGDDSMDECDALLTVPTGCESEVSGRTYLKTVVLTSDSLAVVGLCRARHSRRHLRLPVVRNRGHPLSTGRICCAVLRPCLIKPSVSTKLSRGRRMWPRNGSVGPNTSSRKSFRIRYKIT